MNEFVLFIQCKYDYKESSFHSSYKKVDTELELDKHVEERRIRHHREKPRADCMDNILATHSDLVNPQSSR